MTDTPADGQPTGPPPVALAVAMELVTKHHLRLADQRDSRLGPMAGRYELAAAAWTGKRATLVAFYRPPGDPETARRDLAERLREAVAWGLQRMQDQSTAERSDILLVALGAVPKPEGVEPGAGPVRVGVASVDETTAQVAVLFPIPGGLPGLKELGRHAKGMREGATAPTLAAVDLAERQTIQGGYNQPTRRALDSTPVATGTLMGICIAVWLLEEVFVGKLRGGSFLSLDDFGAASNVGTPADWWRDVSYMFVHATSTGTNPIGIYHIAGNMMALFFFGRMVEQLYGRLILVAVFLITGAGGIVLWAAAASAGLVAAGSTIGASGGIAGLIGFLLVLGRVQGRNVPVGVVSSVHSFVQRNLVFTAVFWIVANGVVNNYVHVGGLLIGAALSCVIAPRSSIGGRDLRLYERVVCVAVIGVSAVALAIAAQHFLSIVTLPPGTPPLIELPS